MVSIAAFQAVDPGSIPGRRKIIFWKSHFVSVADMSRRNTTWMTTGTPPLLIFPRFLVFAAPSSSEYWAEL